MTKPNAKASFTAADMYPIKLLQNVPVLRSIVEKGTIPPAHVQLIPTNKCNLKCNFCSCAEEDKDLQMTKEQATAVVHMLAKMKTQAVTITGGGEPLLFPHLRDLVLDLTSKGIGIGLVTNGLLLYETPYSIVRNLTWCRISHSDDRKATETYLNKIKLTVLGGKFTDWAFSYVVSTNPDMDNIRKIVSLANELNFTHVRLVADLLNPNHVPMEEVSQVIKKMKTTVPVIIQERTAPEKGGECRICYLKPVITPDMNVYACCGAQYALPVPSKKFPKELKLGTVRDMPKLMKQSHKAFPGGEKCVRCYYGDYNRALKMLMTNTTHRSFM